MVTRSRVKPVNKESARKSASESSGPTNTPAAPRRGPPLAATSLWRGDTLPGLRWAKDARLNLSFDHTEFTSVSEQLG